MDLSHCNIKHMTHHLGHRIDLNNIYNNIVLDNDIVGAVGSALHTNY